MSWETYNNYNGKNETSVVRYYTYFFEGVKLSYSSQRVWKMTENYQERPILLGKARFSHHTSSPKKQA